MVLLQALEQRPALLFRHEPWRGFHSDYADGTGPQGRYSIGLVDGGESANLHRHGRLIHDVR